MLQRKQSLWLLLAALLNSGVLYNSLWQPTFESDSFEAVRTNNYFDLLILGVTIIVLPLLAIFMFQNRKWQIRLVWLCISANLIFITDMLIRIHFSRTYLVFNHVRVDDGYYWTGSRLPVYAILFQIMAIIGIRKDEKLASSVDRLR